METAELRATTNRFREKVRARALTMFAKATFVLSACAFGAAGYFFVRPVSQQDFQDTQAMAALLDAGFSLRRDISRVVEPAINRTKMIASNPATVAAFAARSQDALTEDCNRAIRGATEIDAIALFDDEGRIRAINSTYADGKPIAAERVARIMGMSFAGRDIIHKCTNNSSVTDVLEFQTHCDITPAFFDSTGLSVAFSTPIHDPATGKQIGVASSRLRFDRLQALIKSRSVGGHDCVSEFITDAGNYFSEGINSGAVAAPIPTTLLATLVAPLVRQDSSYSISKNNGRYISLFRLDDFRALSGGGIQVMIAPLESWLLEEARQRILLRSGTWGGLGLLLLLIGVLSRGYCAAKSSEETTHMLIDAAQSAIIATDASGVVTAWNSEAERIFGYAPQETIGKSLNALVHPSQPDLLLLSEKVAPSFPVEMTMRTKSGETVLIELSAARISAGTRPMISIFAQDISHRAEQQRQQLHTQKMESIGALAAGIAHEINTPTQYVSDNTRFVHESFCSFVRLVDGLEMTIHDCASKGIASVEQQLATLRRDLDIDFLKEEIPKATEQSLEGLTRIASIVQAMKQFSHPDDNAMQPVDINAAVTSTVTVSRARWKYVAELEERLDPNLPLVPAYLGELNQTILNLIVNAADAIGERQEKTPIKGWIQITTSIDDDYVVIKIADNGGGIPASIQHRVFDPFFTTKDVGKGTGQGLAICHRAIVDRHHGAISFSSIENEGTTFVVKIPLQPVTVASEAA